MVKRLRLRRAFVAQQSLNLLGMPSMYSGQVFEVGIPVVTSNDLLASGQPMLFLTPTDLNYSQLQVSSCQPSLALEANPFLHAGVS